MKPEAKKRFKKALLFNLIAIAFCIITGPASYIIGFFYIVFTAFITFCLLALLLFTRNKEYYAPYLLAELAASAIVATWLFVLSFFVQLY